MSIVKLRNSRRDLSDLPPLEPSLHELLAILLLKLPELSVDFEHLEEIVFVPAAFVERQVSDLGEFFVGFVDERPVDFTQRDAVAGD